MIRKCARPLLVAIGMLAATSSAAFLTYAEPQLKYPAENGWETNLKAHWDYWKGKFNTNGGIIVGTKPDGSDAYTSEAQSYGMLLALWFNDKYAFDQIYGATQTNFWSKGSGNNYAWLIGPSPLKLDPNFAGDADQEICGALIFASALVDAKIWADGNPSYKAQAITILTNIASTSGMLDGSHLIRAYNNSNGLYNPSYMMPGWIQIFKEFGAANGVTDPGWDAVRTAEYNLFNNEPNAKYGMARNWDSDPGNGTETPSNTDMSFDAIRVPYRIGLDAIWYQKHSQAVAWCKSVWDNSSNGVNPSTPGMYLVNGPTLWGWGTKDAANGPFSDAQYEWSLPVAMWGTCAAAVQDSSTNGATAMSVIMSSLKKGVLGHDYFLLSSNPDTTSKSAPNKNYYAQSLALLGALAVDGRAWNVWDDLKNTWTVPDTTTKVTLALTATPSSIPLNTSTHLRAKFSHSISWTLRLTEATGANYTITGTGDSISTDWNTSSHRLNPGFTAGSVAVAGTRPWTTPPAGTTTTITVTAADGIQPVQSHLSAFAWTSEGLRLPANLVDEGASVQVRVLDLSGRQVGASRSAVAHVSGNATVLDLPVQHTAQAGFVEIRTANGGVERLLLPPIR